MRNKELIIKRFARSYENYNKLAVVQQEIAEKLAFAVREFLIEPQKGFEIGSGTGFLTRWLVELYPECNWLINDIVKSSKDYLPSGVSFLEGDGEFVQIPDNQDVISSASTVQWFTDFPKFVHKVKENLAPKGIIAISTFGPKNFYEIFQTTGETLNYINLSQLEDCFVGFEILYKEEWVQQLSFKSPIEVLQHIRATGVNAISDVRWSRERLKQFCNDYVGLCEDPKLTFNPMIIIARKNG